MIFIHLSVIRDARCFLENGATAAHLFVGEDLPVGDTVGVLGVLGDPGPQGDIELRLQELDSPVTFSAYSKNLTLIRPLDKEGVDGPASVYVNVICERKHTLDPVFAHFTRAITSVEKRKHRSFPFVSGLRDTGQHSRD